MRVIFRPHSLFSSDAPVNVPDVPINVPDVPINLQLNERQIWFLKELEKGEKLKSSHLTRHWGIAEKTSKRDIRGLLEHNLIEYVGSLKTGYYRIKHKNG